MTDQQILDGILKREGGYSDFPQDKGGCTNMGITIRTLKEWRNREVTCDDVRRLTREEACDIYRARYLKPFDGVPEDLKAHVVDIAVNSGVQTARRLLATAQTNATARSVNNQLVYERLMHYAKIVQADKSQAVFLTGWMRRAFEFVT